jgi:hypothetical protein
MDGEYRIEAYGRMASMIFDVQKMPRSKAEIFSLICSANQATRMLEKNREAEYKKLAGVPPMDDFRLSKRVRRWRRSIKTENHAWISNVTFTSFREDSALPHAISAVLSSMPELLVDDGDLAGWVCSDLWR